MAEHNRELCLFCRIVDGKEAATQILYQDTKLVIFKDIRPAADHHYLVVTKEHIANAKQLTKEQKPLVQEMVDVGEKFLIDQGGVISDSRFGFHWPPFHAISHLHLHVISPASNLKVMGRIIFRPGLWFITVKILLYRISLIKCVTEIFNGEIGLLFNSLKMRLFLWKKNRTFYEIKFTIFFIRTCNSQFFFF